MSAETMGNARTGTRCSIAPGSGNFHFRLAGCDDCDVRDLAARSLGAVDDLYRQGYVRQPVFEAYMHVWQTSAYRYGTAHASWATPPQDPEVVELVARFRAVLAARKAAS